MIFYRMLEASNFLSLLISPDHGPGCAKITLFEWEVNSLLNCDPSLTVLTKKYLLGIDEVISSSEYWKVCI